MFDFRRKNLCVSSIGKLDFSVQNVVKRYDTVPLQESQTFFLEKNSERMRKISTTSF